MKYFIAFILVLSIFSPNSVRAQYENIDGVFIVTPPKQEIQLNPGESVIRNIYITNKLDHDADFLITVEDISGSKSGDDENVVKYYGTTAGPYSIKNLIMFDSENLRVAAGETKILPVLINVPAKQKPGGYYGGVFVSLENPPVKGGTRVITRTGSLFFLKVKGDVVEQGEIKNFSKLGNKLVQWRGGEGVDFQIAFENKGNIYLNPYGMIEIKNLSGEVIDRLPIEPWFVFPDSTRNRVIQWQGPWYGIFTANLILNHGYTVPHASTQTIKFMIIPLPAIIAILISVAILALVYKLYRRSKKWQI